ncbi:MAG: hypothetical protein AAFZ11_02140 [Pseudomonadota bacterium]
MHERRIAEITFRVILVSSMPMIAHCMGVIAMMNVRHSALVIMPSLMRRPCHARHNEGAYEQEKGCNPEHELGSSAAISIEQCPIKFAMASWLA